MARTFHHSRKFGKRHLWRWGNFYGSTPGWWTRLFMNRPKRLADRRLLHRVVAGSVDPDAATFAVGCRKPHKYYW